MTLLVGRFLPDSLDTREGSGFSAWLAAFGSAVQAGRDATASFVRDMSVLTAVQEGLDRAGERLGVPRPPGMADPFYRILIPTLCGAERGTLYAITAVLSAALGGVVVSAYDQESEGPYLGLIPPFEIWIDVPGDSGGLGLYVDTPSNAAFETSAGGAGYPRESGILGVALDALGDPVAGEQNDHWWGVVDVWSAGIVDSVRLAGTILVYAGTL